jgi:hypothetical protein
MVSKLVSFNSIKSDSQRALAAHWDGLAAGRRFPALSEFKPDSGLYDASQLVVWNIEGEGRQLKFRALYQGESIAEVFSSVWAGKTMDQVVPMSLRRITIGAAKECMASGCAVYSIVSTIDSNEQRVDCERLLLPFGRDGSKVEHILASLQLKSVQQAVRRKKILGHFKIQADVLLSCRVKSGFTKTDTPGACRRLGMSNAVAASAKPPGEKRRASRRNVLRAGRIRFAAENSTCTVRNISATGAAIQGTNLASIPDTFTLVLEMETAERLCTVVWRKKTQIGVRFG